MTLNVLSKQSYRVIRLISSGGLNISLLERPSSAGLIIQMAFFYAYHLANPTTLLAVLVSSKPRSTKLYSTFQYLLTLGLDADRP